MMHFNEESQRALAISNLSQLIFFIAPLSGSVSTNLPKGTAARFALEESLRIIGIDLQDQNETDVMIGGAQHHELNNPEDNDVDLVVDLARGDSVLFSDSGVQKLLDAGVTNPLLDIIRQEKRAA